MENWGIRMASNRNDKTSDVSGAEPSAGLDSCKRRKLLSSIAAGGAAVSLLPQKWSKPVVDSVLLPAHAQMSPGALVACTVTGYLVSGTLSLSQSSTSFNVPSTSPSTFTDTTFSNTTAVPAVAFTYAIASGSMTSVGTYTGSASLYFTEAESTATATGGSVDVTRIISWIFDSTCFG